jgi:hypothetical protein
MSVGRLATGIVAIVFWLIVNGTANAQTNKGTCDVNAVAFSQSSDAFDTASTSPVVIPGMQVTFTQAVLGCLVVQYTSYAWTRQGNASTSFITFMLDGPSKTQTQKYAMNLPQGSAEPRTVTFVFRNVPIGAHTVVMKLSSSDGQRVGSDGPKTLTVSFRK